jgi:flagellar biosynthesis protein FliR
MFVHNIPEIHDFLHALPSILAELLMGLIVGFIAVIIIEGFKKIKIMLVGK